MAFQLTEIPILLRYFAQVIVHTAALTEECCPHIAKFVSAVDTDATKTKKEIRNLRKLRK